MTKKKPAKKKKAKKAPSARKHVKVTEREYLQTLIRLTDRAAIGMGEDSFLAQQSVRLNKQLKELKTK